MQRDDDRDRGISGNGYLIKPNLQQRWWIVRVRALQNPSADDLLCLCNIMVCGIRRFDKRSREGEHPLRNWVVRVQFDRGIRQTGTLSWLSMNDPVVIIHCLWNCSLLWIDQAKKSGDPKCSKDLGLLA